MATDVVSELTATVLALAIQPGSLVKEGDPLIVLESMKMEIPVEAPVSGTVEAVLVREGDLVDEGQIVARIA
jgi:acetyl-CoA carboxylase biotin carboxyl carrier protein